jgi:hypothetical protein
MSVILGERESSGWGKAGISARRGTYRGLAACGALLVAVFFLPESGAGQNGSVLDYRRSLAGIDSALAAGETARARRLATALRGARFTFAVDETFAADAALLERVREARTPEEVLRARAAVARLVAALGRETAGEAAAPEADLLARLAAAQAEDAIAPGGAVPRLEIEEPGFWRGARETVQRALARLREGLWKLLRRLRSALRDLLIREEREGRGRLDTRLVTALVVGLAVLLAVLAVRLFRRRGKAPPLAAAPPPAFDPAADADPLSRRESEWERFAGELAAAGRYREAIRALYHAVLVALYRGGWLHYRKGRTNWEYVSSLPPAAPWRGEFVRLTRRFEEEWYGRRESREEAYRTASEEAERLLGAVGRREAAA